MQNLAPLIFVVGEDIAFNDLIVKHLKENRFQNTKSFSSGDEGIRCLTEKPQIIILDDSLKGITATAFLIKAKKINSHIEFIFLSQQNNIDTAVNAIKSGAFDYIIKDQRAFSKLIFGIKKIIAIQKKIKENNAYRFCVIMFIIILTAIILMVIGLTILFPKKFTL